MAWMCNRGPDLRSPGVQDEFKVGDAVRVGEKSSVGWRSNIIIAVIIRSCYPAPQDTSAHLLERGALAVFRGQVRRMHDQPAKRKQKRNRTCLNDRRHSEMEEGRVWNLQEHCFLREIQRTPISA